jgi:hypothetical protein
LGRQFFNRIKLALQVDTKGKEYRIGFMIKDSPEPPASFRFSMVAVVIAGIALLAFLLMTVFKKKNY